MDPEVCVRLAAIYSQALGTGRDLKKAVYYFEQSFKHDQRIKSGDFSENQKLKLGVAASQGLAEICRFLIENGAEVNGAVADGLVSPLCYAAESGHYDICLLLLEKGARVEGNYELNAPYPLILAVKKGHYKVARLLLGKGADPDAYSLGHFTPALSFAAGNGNGDVEMGKLLLENGANIEKRDHHGYTPLHYAVGNREVCKVLLEKGANSNAQNKLGRTPLQLATVTGDVEICKLLLNEKANVNLCGETGRLRTPLQTAVLYGHSDVCLLLLEKGAMVNAPSNIGVLTPLHIAAEKQYVEIAKLLVYHGADVTKIACGSTPLGVAARKNNGNLIRALVCNQFSIPFKENAYMGKIASTLVWFFQTKKSNTPYNRVITALLCMQRALSTSQSRPA